MHSTNNTYTWYHVVTLSSHTHTMFIHIHICSISFPPADSLTYTHQGGQMCQQPLNNFFEMIFMPMHYTVIEIDISVEATMSL
jgi:hypothetical protein